MCAVVFLALFVFLVEDVVPLELGAALDASNEMYMRNVFDVWEREGENTVYSGPLARI